MNPRCTSRADARRVDPERLATVLDLSLRHASDGTDDGSGGGPALAVGVHGIRSEAFELALHPLVGPDPVRSLFGFVAPRQWDAFGVVAGGTSRRPHAETGHAPGDGDDPTPIHIGVLVSRSGTQALATRRPGGAIDRIVPADQCGGRVPDACRRVLGLATAPPAGDTAELWATLWLETLLAGSLTDLRTIGWAEAVRAFPCFDVVVAGDPDLAALAADHIVELGQAARRAWPWEQLLASCRAGLVPACGLEADEARWMDAGIFSREVLGRFPPLADLLGDLTAVLTVEVVARIEQALAAWGLR